MEKKSLDAKPESGAELTEFQQDTLLSRRDFLLGLKKWSKVVIGGALLGGLVLHPEKQAEAGVGWVNRRGGWGGSRWINGGGGGGWYNRHGGGGWYNRHGGGGGWYNRSGGWANRRGGGGWVNFR